MSEKTLPTIPNPPRVATSPTHPSCVRRGCLRIPNGLSGINLEKDIETKDNAKVIYQIEGCKKLFLWCSFPSSIKTHLSGIYHITKGTAASYLKVLQKESLTKNVIGFVIGTVQPLSIVEDKDFIKMINGFDCMEELPYSYDATEIQEHLVNLFDE
ncbi:hypothetical protein C1645_821391 [Glomus cerebriforme]|uniref:Uncharacterized protein n=1 Tax=Glomus cerebriforme TaxID=658196 RepID=A0A397T6S8_9GLOM|nr:hypothetical protein C1645_821391 [Glomus cerebriforme]